MQKDGAFMTSDSKGVVLIFQNTAKQKPIQWLSGYLTLGARCIGWSRAWSIIQREREIVSRRPKLKHLYLWMMGIEDNERGLKTIIEIRNFIFDYSKKLRLPIYAETTVERNLLLYKRYGFEIYDEWEVPEKGLKVWFIKRDWNFSPILSGVIHIQPPSGF
jgi:hypothetical protein